ncbi:MAG: hypothetical protein ACXAEX_11535 [Promethearchaeota archaeon]|jgi:rubredoxin
MVPQNFMVADYYCPRCYSDKILEYNDFIECPICQLDFDKDLFRKIPDEDILARQEMSNILNPFKELGDPKKAKDLFDSILDDFENKV